MNGLAVLSGKHWRNLFIGYICSSKPEECGTSILSNSCDGKMRKPFSRRAAERGGKPRGGHAIPFTHVMSPWSLHEKENHLKLGLPSITLRPLQEGTVKAWGKVSPDFRPVLRRPVSKSLLPRMPASRRCPCPISTTPTGCVQGFALESGFS